VRNVNYITSSGGYHKRNVENRLCFEDLFELNESNKFPPQRINEKVL